MAKIQKYVKGTEVTRKSWKLQECKVTCGEVGLTALPPVLGFCSAVMAVEDMDAGRNSVSDGGSQNPNTQVASVAMAVYKRVADGTEVTAVDPS